MGYVVAATNVPPGRFGEVPAGSYDGAWFVARHRSIAERGVAFTSFEVRDDGAYALATFLNGERRFTATD